MQNKTGLLVSIRKEEKEIKNKWKVLSIERKKISTKYPITFLNRVSSFCSPPSYNSHKLRTATTLYKTKPINSLYVGVEERWANKELAYKKFLLPKLIQQIWVRKEKNYARISLYQENYRWGVFVIKTSSILHSFMLSLQPLSPVL